MEPSRHRSHQQSPSHRSPESSHPSLVGLAQSYERNHHGQPTAAQQYAKQQIQQLQQQQQKYETLLGSPGSSTAVDSRTTFGSLPLDSKSTAATTATNTSDFGSAFSIDNELIHCVLNTTDPIQRNGTDDEDDDDDDQHRKRQEYPFKHDPSSNSDDDGERLAEDELDTESRQTQDEEMRGYRRTPRSHRFFLQLHNSASTTDDDDDDDLESTCNKKNGDIGINHDGGTEPDGEHGGGIWYDYQPDYGMLNESYQTTKRNIYKDIQLTLGHLQQLETQFDSSKIQFHGRIEKEYEAWSYQLDLQKQSLVEHKRRLDDGEPQNLTTFPNKIKLNVGGDVFETSLATLKKDRSSLLAAMFSGKHSIESDQEGSYFIDRDPTHFRLVLNYLRDLRISPSVIQDKVIGQELLQEAEFYNIEGLIKLLEQ